MPSLWTRQGASAFNQPLSIDTSSVTSMEGMFQVRSAPAHATTPICLPLQRRRLQPFSPARLPPSQHASRWTRQSTSAFNQPLSFATSSVTYMQYMFSVRSAPARATRSPVGPMLRVP